MIKNYYWAMAVIAAFVAGTIATATPVFAPPPGDDDDGEGGWKLAVEGLQEQIDTLGTVTCTDITGGAGLCDGSDDIASALEHDPTNVFDPGFGIDDDIQDSGREICPTSMVMRGLTVSQNPVNIKEFVFTVHCAELKVIP